VPLAFATLTQTEQNFSASTPERTLATFFFAMSALFENGKLRADIEGE
jgi:hypothetical protein